MMYTKDKTVRLMFRVSESCYGNMVNQMKMVGMNNLSEFLRLIVESHVRQNDEVGLKIVEGPYAKGLIYLTNLQKEDLISKMGEDMFNHYCDRLSTFMVKKNANLKDHYKFIREWWEGDLKRQTQTSGINVTNNRHGTFDPEDAFKNALKRTYGDS